MSKERRRYHPHETDRQHALSGLPLATPWQRLAGFTIDLAFAVVVWFPLEALWRIYGLHEQKVELNWDFHEKGNIIVMLLYWGLFNYFGNGRSPGKWIAGTRIMSLTGERMGLWQSFERALGYGAAGLEAGLGFAQLLWDRSRMCAQDRLAETIVIDVRKASSEAPR